MGHHTGVMTLCRVANNEPRGAHSFVVLPLMSKSSSQKFRILPQYVEAGSP